MATAKLHILIQTRNMKDPEEGAYLLYFMNRIVQQTIGGKCLRVLCPASLSFDAASKRAVCISFTLKCLQWTTRSIIPS
jgi:hypothetical protein